MALPEVNPKSDSDSKDEARSPLVKIFSKDISRQVLQKNITEGQLDLKKVLEGMSKTLDEMVKMDRDALKRMKEQAGFKLEKEREADREKDDGRGHYAERAGFGDTTKDKKKGLLSTIFSSIGGIFKGLGALGAGLLKTLGFGALLGGGLKAGFKTLFSKKFFKSMLGRFAIPGLLLTYSKDIGDFLAKEFKDSPVSGLFEPSKLGSQSIATFGLQGGAAAAMIFGANPAAILIGAAAGLAVGAAVHITDWLRDRANKAQEKIKGEMDKAIDKSADVEGAAETERKKTGKVSKDTEKKTVAAQQARTKSVQRVLMEGRRAQGAPNVFEASSHQTGLKMDTKKPDSTSQDKQAYNESQRIMAKIREEGYFDNPPDIIKEDARFLRYLIEAMKQGWAHRYFGGDHKKALALWKQMMQTMDFLGKNAPKAAGASSYIDSSLMQNMKALEKFHAMAPGKEKDNAKFAAAFHADQIQKSLNAQKNLGKGRNFHSDAKKGLTGALMGGNIEAHTSQTLGSAIDWDAEENQLATADVGNVVDKQIAQQKAQKAQINKGKGQETGYWTVKDAKGIIHRNVSEAVAKDAAAHGLFVSAPSHASDKAAWYQKLQYEASKRNEKLGMLDEKGTQKKFIADYEAGNLPFQKDEKAAQSPVVRKSKVVDPKVAAAMKAAKTANVDVASDKKVPIVAVKKSVVPSDRNTRRRGSLKRASFRAANANANINAPTNVKQGDTINTNVVNKTTTLAPARSKDDDQDRSWWNPRGWFD